MNIKQHTIVAIDYVLTKESGEVIDSSQGQEPLAYLHGVGHLVPGLEEALEGKKEGDVVKAVVPPGKAYGGRNEDMVQDIPRERFPDGMTPEVGMTLQAQSPAGPRMVTIVAVDGENVRIDANHPLAGITLCFDVTVRGVREATPQELAQAQGQCDSGGGSCGSGCDCSH